MLRKHLDKILLLQCASIPAGLTYEVMHEENNDQGPESNSTKNETLGSLVINELIEIASSLHENLFAIYQTIDIEQYCAHTLEMLQMLSEVEELLKFADSVAHWKCTVSLGSSEALSGLVDQLYGIVRGVKSRFSLALEYHELRTVVISEIRRSALDPSLSATDIEPLLFSLRYTLPNRIRQFAQTAEPHFISEVKMLQNQASNLLRLVEKKINEFRLKELRNNLNHDNRSKRITGSPHLTKIPIFRGLKHCQQLGEVNTRIASSEEYIKHFRLRGSPKTIIKASPRTAMTRKAAFSKPRSSHTVIKRKAIIPAPTKIENGRIIGPTWADLYGFKYCQFYKQMSTNIRTPLQKITKNQNILQKTAISTPNPNRNHQVMQKQPQTSQNSTIKEPEPAETPNTTLNNASFGFPPSLSLSTPLDSRFLDTPLAKKGDGYIPRHNLVHQNSRF